MDRSDYEEKADEAVRSFMDTQKPLGDSVVEIAKRDSLNPEQIKRIVEMANTGAFLEMFKNKSGDDRMVEFPTANADEIIKRFYEQGAPLDGGSPMSSGSFFDDVTDENNLCDLPKMAETHDKTASWEPRVEAISKQKLAVRIDRAREVLSDKMAAAFYDAEELSLKLSRKFQSVYDRPKLAAFEQDALAHYGPEAVYGFNAVRSNLREQLYPRLPEAGRVKQAAEFHVSDTSTPEMTLLGEFMAKVSELRKYQHAKRALEVEYGL